MKKFYLLAMILLVSIAGYSQNAKDYETENEGWLVLLDYAYAESQKTGKPIMANFTDRDS